MIVRLLEGGYLNLYVNCDSVEKKYVIVKIVDNSVKLLGCYRSYEEAEKELQNWNKEIYKLGEVMSYGGNR